MPPVGFVVTSPLATLVFVRGAALRTPRLFPSSLVSSVCSFRAHVLLFSREKEAEDILQHPAAEKEREHQRAGAASGRGLHRMQSTFSVEDLGVKGVEGVEGMGVKGMGVEKLQRPSLQPSAKLRERG